MQDRDGDIRAGTGEAAGTSRGRERAALVIFALLLVIGGIVLIGYFSTGRSWSVAATFLDDSVGSLEDYSVIVFNGVVEPEPAKTKKGVATVSRDNTMEDAYAGMPERADEQRPGVAEVIMSAYRRLDKRNDVAAGDFVYASDVRDLYELKGASAISINIGDPMCYAEPIVLDSGGKRFGVFSVSSYTSRAQLKKIVERLKDSGADAVVCVAPRDAMVATYDGLDVLVLTDGHDVILERVKGTKGAGEVLVVPSPERGSAGVILFSSNNVPSFKMIEEL